MCATGNHNEGIMSLCCGRSATVGFLRVKEGAVLNRTSKNVAAALTLTATSASFALLVKLSQKKQTYSYNFGTVVLLAEIIKFITTFVLLKLEMRRNRSLKMTTKWRAVIKYVVPSLIYTVLNNLQFMTLKYVDPMTYESLRNVNIITTGIVFRVMFNRKLSQTQWLSLVLLSSGITTSQITCGRTAFRSPVEGYFFGILSAFLSSLAGVYTEKVMKEVDDCLHWQNLQLYAFGIITNACSIALRDASESFAQGSTLLPTNLLKGYDLNTWLLTSVLSFTGLTVSFVLKYAQAGSILKVYASAMAVFPVALISSMIFDSVLTIQFAFGMITAIISLILYYQHPETQLGK